MSDTKHQVETELTADELGQVSGGVKSDVKYDSDLRVESDIRVESDVKDDIRIKVK